MNKIVSIAVVDDHNLFRKGIAMLIGLMSGYKVIIEAENGKDFQEKIKTSTVPDLLLLDITMPQMDGYETAKWVCQNYPEIKILALSTMDSDSSIIRMIKAGAKGYILKDADPEELKLAFSETLAKGYYYNDLVSKKIVNSLNLLTDENSNINSILRLTPRETEFLRMACSEKSYSEIAKEMFVSDRTIDSYRDGLFKKLNVNTRVGLVMYAIKNGIVKL